MLPFLIKLSSSLSFLSPTFITLQAGRKVPLALLFPSRLLLPSLFMQKEKSPWLFSLPFVSCFHCYLGEKKSPFGSSLSLLSLASIALWAGGKVWSALLPPSHLLLPLLSKWEENLGSFLSPSTSICIVIQARGRSRLAPLSWFPCSWMHALNIMLLSQVLWSSILTLGFVKISINIRCFVVANVDLHFIILCARLKLMCHFRWVKPPFLLCCVVNGFILGGLGLLVLFYVLLSLPRCRF